MEELILNRGQIQRVILTLYAQRENFLDKGLKMASAGQHDTRSELAELLKRRNELTVRYTHINFKPDISKLGALHIEKVHTSQSKYKALLT